MGKWVIQIFDWMHRNRGLRTLSWLGLTAVLAVLVAQLHFQEDIADFLPLDHKYHASMRVFREMTGSDRIMVLVQYRDTLQTDADTLTEAVDDFVTYIREADTPDTELDMMWQVDRERVDEVMTFVGQHLPYFLTDDDYVHIDSILSSDDRGAGQLALHKQLLMLPGSSWLTGQLPYDPLGLFKPIMERLQKRGTAISYENYNDHLFTPDLQTAIIIITSPYGGSETAHNAHLIDFLTHIAERVEDRHPSITIQLTGGPVIAVDNARQIKNDSILAVSLALLLIILLLWRVFRQVWNMLLIIVSIAWGWLFALGGMYLLHDQVSIIVIGISSVILGIAVNYPLHLIAHLKHTQDVRSALRDIAMPLLVGNITTVGAFLALVPLQSVALRDLGLFSALLLVGTIIFVLLYLPHVVKTNTRPVQVRWLEVLSNVSLENRRWLFSGVVLLTLVFGYFSLQTEFDANIAHINYLTPQQQENLQTIQQLQRTDTATQTVYVVVSDSTLDKSLEKSQHLLPTLRQLQAEGAVEEVVTCQPFICSRAEQQRRLNRWNDLVAQHGEELRLTVEHAARSNGFADGTFQPFLDMLQTVYEPQDASVFRMLASTLFPTSLVTDSTRKAYSVVTVVKTSEHALASLEERIERENASCMAFDVKGMNETVANTLSDDFNYIGWACGLIVFCFLWISLGTIELAILAFLPMAVSWVWILGIMALCDIQFNVVNVILATFIFGQGDDYTIFMTEGCQYEYAYRRKMLASYKNSIILSALLMFIGIGTLILAKHPALYSLAQVTVVGMFSVVLMAFLFPPLVFQWLVNKGHVQRRRPLTLRTLLFRSHDNDYLQLVRDRYRYRGIEIYSTVRQRLRLLKKQRNRLEALSPHAPIVILNNGWGEVALTVALMRPQTTVLAFSYDADQALVADYAAEGIAPMLQTSQLTDESQLNTLPQQYPELQWLLIQPTADELERYRDYRPIVIQ